MRPAVVVSRGDDADLLEGKIADVGDPQVPRERIEAHAEGVTKAPGEDLATRARLAEEWVVGRDGAVEVDAQDLALDGIHVLRVRIRCRPGAADVVAVTGVTDAHVQLAVGPDA